MTLSIIGSTLGSISGAIGASASSLVGALIKQQVVTLVNQYAVYGAIMIIAGIVVTSVAAKAKSPVFAVGGAFVIVFGVLTFFV